MAAQSGGGIGAEPHAGAPRHVVEDHRQGAGVKNRVIVPNQAGLRGFVVIRRDAELTGSAEPLRLTGIFNGAARVVGAGADDNGNRAARTFKADFNDAFALIHRKRAWLARCAQQNKRVHLRRYLHCEQAAKRGLIQPAIRQKRRNQRGGAAGKQRKIHQAYLPTFQRQRKAALANNCILSVFQSGKNHAYCFVKRATRPTRVCGEERPQSPYFFGM